MLKQYLEGLVLANLIVNINQSYIFHGNRLAQLQKTSRQRRSILWLWTEHEKVPSMDDYS